MVSQYVQVPCVRYMTVYKEHRPLTVHPQRSLTFRSPPLDTSVCAALSLPCTRATTGHHKAK